MTISGEDRPASPCTRAAEAPRVSVIMIFLNAERFLSEAIESVLAQTYRNFELILVDDGSGPPCTAIARAYAERYAPFVRYMDHEGHRNRGMSASRNLGLSAARGELVAFIDADDVWAPQKLSEQVAIMDANPELGMVCGAVRYWISWGGGKDSIIPTGHIANTIIHPPEAALALYPLGKAAAPCPSDLLMRTELVRRLGGFEEHFTGARQLYEDQAFLAKLYLAAPVHFSDRVWLNYRQHAGSCVAEVVRGGRYHEVRRYFLGWLKEYLARLPHVDERVARAVDRALWPYRHPLLSTLKRRSASLLERGRRAGRRLARGTLRHRR